MSNLSSLSLDLDSHVQSLLEKQLGEVDIQLTQNNEAIRLSRGGLVMDLDWIGEGYEGYYDEDDPEDAPLLRFSFYVQSNENDELTELSDSSYCTHLTLHLPLEARLYAAGILLNRVYEVTGPESDPWGSGVKRTCESLSTIGNEEIESFMAEHLQAEMDKALPEASSRAATGPRL